MTPAILLTVILAAATAPTGVGPTASDQAIRGATGPWRLSEIGGKVGCTLNLSADVGPGGRVLQAPAACHQAFPPLGRLTVWSVDARGAPIFADPRHRHTVIFAGPPGGPFEATAPDGRAWRLEPAAPRPAAPAAP